ncbi:MAG: flagellar hook-basal body complex protein [Planctomycetes bacterium]|nr:flagellar hook-basal body complex protein [Planctomycetota bacterium]
MALVRALNSAIGGLRSQQFRIDTIGDNLANSTTAGFKTARVEFETMLAQNLSFGSAPQGFLGGIDPMQIGLGVRVASTTRDFGQGELEVTGRTTDLGIDGDGFFILKDEAGGVTYSRDGSFTINPQNLLHNPSNGFIVQGIQADFTTFTVASGAPVQNLSIPVGTLTVAVATQNATYDGNLRGDGTQALMGTVLETQTLLDNSLGFTPATAATLLENLSRDTGAGFIDLALDTGDVVTVNAVKGGRSLGQKRFSVGTALPTGFDGFGTTLGEFTTFLQRVLGINDTGTNYGAMRDNDTNPNTAGITFAAGSFPSATEVQVTGVDFAAEGVQAGDILRFNTGPGAGQIGTVTGLATSGLGPPFAANDTIVLAAPFSTGSPAPAAGDQFSVHEKADVTVNPTAVALPFTLNPGLTPGRMRIAGNVGVSNAITTLEIANSTDNVTFSPFSQIDAATGESIITNATYYDSLGAPHLVELTWVLETKGGVDAVTGSVGNTFRFFGEAGDSKFVAGTSILGTDRVVGTGTVTFSTAGQFLSTSPIPSVSLSIPNTGAATPLSVNFDLAGLTGFASQNSNVFLTEQDGFAMGTLKDFSVGVDGKITGMFDNGLTRTIGQVMLARFANPNGLSLVGQNNYDVAANSGTAIVGQPGQISLGSILSGTLEASNVDFAKEFTNLIVSQRAFQANARVITTADRLLEELVGLR